MPEMKVITSFKRISAKHLQKSARWISAAILLLMFTLALTSMVQKAPTFDEQGFIVRGLGYLRGYRQIRVGHPLGLNIFNAAFLANDDGVALPLDDPSWSGSSFHRPGELFLWEIGNDVSHIMFLARLPSIWLGLLLAALTGRWTWRVSKKIWPGILALLFIALDPNILAHMRLATTDLGLTAFSVLAGYTLWHFLKKQSWRGVLLAGIALGLLQNTKFTALLFIPLFAVIIIIGLAQMWASNKRASKSDMSVLSTVPWRLLLMVLIVYPLVALVTLWAAYGFEIGTMPPDMPMFSLLAGRSLPLAQHFEQLLDIGGRLQVGTPSFLLGQYSEGGWWDYFPVAFMLKTPLPTLIVLGWGAAAFILGIFRSGQGRRKNLSGLDSAALLVPAVGYFAIALTTDINLGYRHILPILPFLIIFSFASIATTGSWEEESRRVLTTIFLAVWLIVGTLFIYPDFLAYFNNFAGGPENGWRSLVDSNIDWGQDLDDLPQWMAENKVDEVWLSYFGEARPDYYGISYQGLDSFPPRFMNPQARPFFPQDPAPGIYAISATNLQGVQFANHDQFSWFRDKKPIDKLGYTIFLYEVPAHGGPVSLLLSGVQVDEILPEDFVKFGSNDIRPRWFDMSEALIIPSSTPAWLIYDSELTPPQALTPYYDQIKVVADNSDKYQIARFDKSEIPENTLVEFSHENGKIGLLDVEKNMAGKSEMTIVTTWEQIGEPQPLKIFIHVIGKNGEIITQWDGLGLTWEGWGKGDKLVQVHNLVLPEELVSSDYRLLIGIYNPLTNQRWLTDQNQDHAELE